METRKWLDRNEYPFTSHYFHHGTIRQHYIDEGAGDVIVFVHGTPSWSFDFRNVVKELSTSFRCVAIDHVGFGLSDKPHRFDYSTQHHAIRLSDLISHLALTDITLVVHDFGGPIGLSIAEANPHIVKNIVVLNSWLWNSEEDEGFKKLKRVLESPLLPFLYKYLNFSARFVMPSSFGRKKLGRKLKKQFTAPFASQQERGGTIAFVKSLLHDQEWFERLWVGMSVLSEKPCLFVWGIKDPVLKPHYLEKFKTGFAHATVIELPDCGHFPQEEEPVTVANSIRNSLQHQRQH